jgi:hypothetical protein
MSALTATRVVLVREATIKKTSMPLAAGEKVFKGGAVAYDTARPGAMYKFATGVTTMVPFAWASDDVDNSAGSSAVSCPVECFREHFIQYWDSVTGANAITSGNLFDVAYGADDHTLTKSSTTASKYGRVWAFSPQGYPGAIGVEPVYGADT